MVVIGKRYEALSCVQLPVVAERRISGSDRNAGGCCNCRCCCNPGSPIRSLDAFIRRSFWRKRLGHCCCSDNRLVGSSPVARWARLVAVASPASSPRPGSSTGTNASPSGSRWPASWPSGPWRVTASAVWPWRTATAPDEARLVDYDRSGNASRRASTIGFCHGR